MHRHRLSKRIVPSGGAWKILPGDSESWLDLKFLHKSRKFWLQTTLSYDIIKEICWLAACATAQPHIQLMPIAYDVVQLSIAYSNAATQHWESRRLMNEKNGAKPHVSASNNLPPYDVCWPVWPPGGTYAPSNDIAGFGFCPKPWPSSAYNAASCQTIGFSGFADLRCV